MTKYINSDEAVTSNLMFFSPMHTQTSILSTNVYEVYPQTSLDFSDVIPFLIKAHPKQMIQGIEIVTNIRVLTATGENPPANTNVSVVSNLSHAIWRSVDVVVGGQNLMQSFDNSYNIGSWFNTVLNSDENRKDYLFRKQLFLMDNVETKANSENTNFYPDHNAVPVNTAARRRADRIKRGQRVTLISDLDCSLFRTGKLLPSNLDVRIALTKNYSGYVLLEPANGTHKLVFDKCYLRVTVQQPTDFCLQLVEQKLKIQPAIYQAEQGVVNFFSLTAGTRTATINNLFPQGKLPIFFVIAISTRDCYGETRNKNPYTYHRINKIQVYIDSVPYFSSALSGNTQLFDNFYQSIGRKTAGGSLLADPSFNSHHIIPVDLTADRNSNKHHLNLSRTGDVKVNLEAVENLPEGALLMCYSYYDRIIAIDSDRNVHIQ